jgi:hypothetical protein
VESRVVFRRSQGAGGQWVLEVHGRDAGEGAAAYQIFLRATRRTYAGDGVDTVEWRVAGPDGYPNGPADDGDACDVVLGGSVGMRAMRIRATEDAGGNKLLRFMLDDALPETNPPTALLDIYPGGKIVNPSTGVNLVGSFKMSVPIACATPEGAGWTWNQLSRRWECSGITTDKLRVDLPAFLFSGGTTRFKSITAYGSFTQVSVSPDASVAMTIFAEKRSAHNYVGSGASWTVTGAAEKSGGGMPVNVDATSHYFITFDPVNFLAAGDGFSLYDIIVEFETV